MQKQNERKEEKKNGMWWKLAIVLVALVILLGSCKLYEDLLHLKEPLNTIEDGNNVVENPNDGTNNNVTPNNKIGDTVDKTIENIKANNKTEGLINGENKNSEDQEEKNQEDQEQENPEEPEKEIVAGSVLLLTLNGENSGLYSSLQTAINKAENTPAYIYLLEDINENVVTERPQTLIINLNGKKLDSKGITLINKATLNLIDTNIEELDTVVEVLNGEDESKKVSILHSYPEIIAKNKLTPTGTGIIKTTAGIDELGIGIYNTGKLTITSGEVKSELVEDVEVGYAIYNYGELANLRINGGKITSTGAIENVGIYNYFTIDGLDIKGGEINVTSKNARGIANYNSVATIEKVDITIEGSQTGYGIINNEAELKILGGKIDSKSNGTEYTQINGVYNTENASLVLGESINVGIDAETTPNIENPEISGTTSGIRNENGIFEFFDGIIKSPNTTIDGNVTRIERKYDIYRTEENGIKSAYLSRVSKVKTEESVALIIEDGEENYYTTLEGAIATVEEGKETTLITMLKNTQESVTIGKEKNIKLDLAGYTVTSNKITLKNKGTLEIIDTGSNGRIETTENYSGAIENNAELVLTKGTISALGDAEGYGIYNFGNAAKTTINGGTVISNARTGSAITNELGSVILSQGTISETGNSGYGIKNSNGKLSITGGSVNASGEYGTGIYNATGTITLGSKEDAVSITIPTITAGAIGIFNYDDQSTLNFYDGIIKGKTNWKNDKGVLVVPQLYVEYVSRPQGSEYEVAVLLDAVAQIGEKNYAYLSDAVAAVPTNNEQTTIKMLRDVYIKDVQTISNNKNIILDLNGKTITGRYEGINNQGTLKIKDSSTDGKIKTTNSTAVRNSGTLTLENGNIESRSYGISNTGSFVMEDGTITIAGAGTYGYGIYTTNGTLTVKKGTIDASSTQAGYGIYTTVETVINLGTNEDELDITNPYIAGKTNGIYAPNGSVNIYNGIIKGEEAAIVSFINRVKTLHEIKQYTQDEYDVITLQPRDTQLTANTVAVIEDEEGTQYFRSLENAITYVARDLEQPTIITIVKNTQEIVEVPNRKNIIIDLNGKTISSENDVITNNGILEIRDSETTGTIQTTGERKSTIINNNYLQIESGNIIATNGTAIVNNKNLTVNNGIINGTNCGVTSDDTTYINGGKIYGEDYGINTTAQSTLYFNAGQLSGKQDWKNNLGILIIPEGKEVKVTTADGYENATIIESDTTKTDDSVAKITRGTVTKYYKSLEGALSSITNNPTNNIYTNNAVTTITMLKDTQETVSIRDNQVVTIDLNGFNISSNAITITNNKILKIQGNGQVSTSGNEQETGIAIKNNMDATIASGKILATGTTNGKAIYNNNGTLTIGTQGGEVSTTNPEITGTEYGVYKNSGVVRFFDGKISGKIDSNYGSIDYIQSGYDLNRLTAGDYTTLILSEPSLIYTSNSVATIERNGTNYYYNSISGAINSILPEEENVLITMLKSTTEGAIIPEEKEVTLDLKGYTIESGYKTITINGELTLIDTVGNGQIIGSTNAIENNNVFNYNAGILKGRTRAIDGKITTMPIGYEVSITNDGEYEVATLILSETEQTADSVAKISRQGVNYYYRSLYAAINTVESSENKVTITMLKNTTEMVEIYEDQDISLDLNGKTVNSADKTITNNGTLEIVNNQTEGAVTSNINAIINNGILNINGAKIQIENVGTVIINNSTVNINSNGTILATGENCIGIQNNNGTVNLLEGSIEMTGAGSIGVNNNGDEAIVNVGEDSGIANLKYNITPNSENCQVAENNEKLTYIGSVAGIVEGPLRMVNKNISISGENYGVCNGINATLNFYDGSISGGKEWKNERGELKIKDGCEVEIETTDEYRIATLTEMETELTENTVAILTLNNYTYYFKSLNGALSAITSNEDSIANIQMVKNTQENVIINNTQKIVLDLNGKTISSPRVTINNAGDLVIKDLSEEQNGKIETTSNIESTAIAIINNGNLYIENAKIEALGQDYGIGIYSNSKAYIGVNDQDVSIEKPEVIGTTFGISNIGGTLGFYDGIIKGKVQPVSGNVNIVPNSYEIIGTYKDQYYQIVLKKFVAQVGEERFETLAEAIEYVGEGNDTTEIVMLNNTVETVIIPSSKNITINLSGKVISSEGTTITNNGTLIITSNGVIKSTNDASIKNIGTLIVENGRICTEGDKGTAIENIGTTIIGTKGGTISKTSPCVIAPEYGIDTENGILEFYDGKISGKTNAINGEFSKIEENSELVIEQVDGYEQVTLSKYVAILDEVKYESIQEAVNKVPTTGMQKTIQIINNTIETTRILPGQNIILDLNGYNVSSSYNTITNTGDLEIVDTKENGTLTTTSNAATITNNGDLKITSGIITTQGTRAITNSNTLKVEGGKVIASAENAIAIYNTSNVTIGIKDGNVSTEVPEIIGTSFGVYNYENTNANTSMYDGIIKGKQEYVFGNIKTVEENYELNEITQEQYKIVTLILMDTELTQNTVASVTSGETTKYYRTIKNAINSIKNNESAIKIEKSTTESINIDSNNKINIDLNGKTIEYAGTVIKNNSVLDISDSVGEAVIQSTNGGIAVENNNQLTLNSGNVSSTQSGGKGIYNTYRGVFNFNNGKVIGRQYSINTSGTIIVPQGCMVLKTRENENEVATIVPYVATIADRKYATLQSAIDDCNESTISTINLVLDIEESVSIPAIKLIDINLNGKSITSNATTITNAGELKIYGTGSISTSGENSDTILNNGKLNVSTGTIISENGNGINNNGEVIIGDQVSITIPEVKGKLYGVYNANEAVMSFNSGAIKGTTNWKNDQGTLNIRPDYEVEINTEDEYKVATLVLPFIDMPAKTVAAIRRTEENDYYETLQLALDSIETGLEEPTTIIMLDNTEEQTEILNGQKVIIDLNGKTIQSEATSINNNGELCLKDEKGDGSVKGKEKAINGNVPTTEEKYEILQYTEDEYDIIKVIETSYEEDPESGEIEKKTIVAVIPSLDGIKVFTKVADAVESIGIEGDNARIILIRDASEQITINNGQKVTLDLNGKILSSDGITITNNGEFKLIDSQSNGTVKTTATDGEILTAINNQSILTVKNGVVVESINGYGINNNGQLILGENGGIPSKVNPEIIGEQYGIYNVNEYVKINFYDGIIKGKLGWYNNLGEVTIQDRQDLTVGEADGYNYAILEGGVAKIGTVYYTSLQNAINAVEELSEGVIPKEENATTIIIRESLSESVTVPANKNIIIDIDGRTITSQGTTITNNGYLTIINGTVTTTEQLNEENSNTIINKNSLQIINGEISNQYGNAILNQGTQENKAIATIGTSDYNVIANEPKIEGINGIYEQDENSTINMYDGIIIGSDDSIYGTVETAELGYTIQNTDYTTYKQTKLVSLDKQLQANSVVSIKYQEQIYYANSLAAAIITAPINTEEQTIITVLKEINESVIIPENKNIQLDLNGNTITSVETIIENRGTLDVIDSSESKLGKIENTSDDALKSICIRNKSILKLESGTINTTGVTYGYAILNDAKNAETTVTGGNVISNGTSGRAIYCDLGNVFIEDGNITANGNSAFGIYVAGIEEPTEEIPASRVIVGVKGGAVSKIQPVVTGGAYGIYVEYPSCQVEFYDGIIRGRINWKNAVGKLSIEQNCDVITSLEDDYQQAILDRYVALIGSNKYETLQSAIDAVAKTGVSTTITLVGNVEEQVTTYEGQKIVLQMAGFELTSTGVTIVNNATLELINNGTTGEISTSGKDEYTGTNANAGVAIVNKGVLNLTSADIKATNSNYGYGIYNCSTGSINFNGGSVSGKTEWKYGEGTVTPKANYKIEITEENGYKVATLVDWYVAKIGETRYKTLALAVAAVPTDKTETTIVMYEDVTESVTIANTKNVVLELNGKTISSKSAGMTIMNQGILKVVDSSKEKTGKIEGLGTSTSYSAIRNQSNSTSYQPEFTLESGTIDGGSQGIGIYNYCSGSSAKITCTINEGRVTGYRGIDNSGITTTNQTIITRINGGEIEGSDYGIYNMVPSNYTGTMINTYIGTSGEELSITSPLITGKTAGIYQRFGIVNTYFYDGKIRSGVTEPISNDTTYPGNVILEENCQMIEYNEDGYRTGILVNAENTDGKVASIITPDGRIELYYTLQAAIDAVEPLQEGVEATEENITAIILLANDIESAVIPANKNINLCLNDKELTSEGTTITNNGTLKISNRNAIGKVITTGNTEGTKAIENNGTLRVEGGSILANEETYGTAILNNGEKAVVTIGAETTFSYANPTIKGTEYGINNENGTYNFYAGRIYGKLNATKVNESNVKDTYEVRRFMEVGYEGKILLPAGNTSYVSALSTETTFDVYTAVTCGTGTVIMLQNVNLNSTIIVNEAYNMVLELNGKTISSTTVTISNRGILKIVDGSLDKTGLITASKTGATAIENYLQSASYISDLTVESGTIYSENYYGIYNYNTAGKTLNCKIDGGTIKGTYGVWNYANSSNCIINCIITGGSIEGTESGIYSRAVSGTASVTINLGITGDDVSTTTPIITGKTSGIGNYIDNTGTIIVNYNDGKIKSLGSEVIKNSRNSAIINTETNYQILEYMEDNYRTNILAKSESMVGKIASIITPAGQITTYDTLQAAIDAVEPLEDGVEATDDNITRITLLANVAESVVIPINKNINLSLNDKELTSDGTTITNKGTLKISNNSAVGKVITTANTESTKAIENKGVLQVEGGSIIANSEEYGTAISSVGENAVLTIGSETTFSYANPTIKGTEYGINNETGTYNFYAGRIYGKTNATNVDESSVKDTYEAREFTEIGYEGKILLPQGDTSYIAAIPTDTTFELYTSLASAIAVVPTGNIKTTIIILQDTAISPKIENKKNIVIELNGKTQTGTITNQGTLEIYDSSRNGTGKIIGQIYNYTEKLYNINFTLNSGTIDGKNSAGIYNYIYNDLNTRTAKTINCTINGGEVIGRVGIENSNYNGSTYEVIHHNNCYINGGIIQGTGTYGIYNHEVGKYDCSNYPRQSGYIDVVIGEKDGNIIINNPIIIGENGGVYQTINTGHRITTSFYDGKIKTKTGVPIRSIKGSLRKDVYEYYEDNCELFEYGEDGYRTAILVQNSNMEGKVALVPNDNGIALYDTVQDAIDAIEETTEETADKITTITLLSNTEENVIVPEKKNIEIYLKGKTITSAGVTIKNNGTLRITDTSAEGKIITTGNIEGISAIVNNGTLQVEGGSIIANGEIYGTAILDNCEDVKITIGTESSTNFSYANPTIRGTEYGIDSKNETYNYYSGRIYGKDKTTNVSEGSIKDKYEVREFMEDGYKGKVLLPQGDVTYKSALSTETSFNLSSTSQIGTGILVILQDMSVSSIGSISAGIDMVLELNGKTITSTATGSSTITNRGKLRVVDSSSEGTGKIIGKGSSTSYGVIYNESGTAYQTEFTLESGTIDGGKLESGIYNNCNGTNAKIICTINGGKVIGNYAIANLGITNSSQTIICRVTDGELEGTKYGIANQNTTSYQSYIYTYIGTPGEEVDITNPIIIADVGIYQLQKAGEITTYFYDGKICARIDDPILQDITYPGNIITEENYKVVEYNEKGCRIARLTTAESVEGKVAAIITEEGQIATYNTLQDAINTVEPLGDGVEATDENITEITLLVDTTESVVIQANKNINLSLNNKELSSEGITITNNGTLKISNNTARGKIITTGNTEGISAIANTGILQVEGGSIIANSEEYGTAILSVGESAAITIGSKEAFSYINPIIKATEYGINNESGIYNFYSGRIYGKTNATNVDESSVKDTYEAREFTEIGYEGKILLPQGDTSYIAAIPTDTTFKLYTSLASAITAVPTGNIKTTIIILQDTAISPKIENKKNIVIELNGKTQTGTITNQGTLEIYDSSRNGTGKIIGQIYNYTEKLYNINFTLNSGTIDGKNSAGIYNYIYNDLNTRTAKTINCTINGGEVIGRVGIENSNYNGSTYEVLHHNNCYINGGIIQGTGTYGIYNNEVGRYDSSNYPSRSGYIDVVIGEKDGNITINNPIIIGETGGVYQTINTGNRISTSFYDGKIKTKTGLPIRSIKGSLRKDVYEYYEDNCELIEYMEDEYDTIIQIGNVNKEGKVALRTSVDGVVLYDTVQSAIDDIDPLSEGVEANDTNISKVIMVNNSTENITIPANKNIELYLNGKTITSAGTTITNNGTLKITDKSAAGKVETTANVEGTKAIENNGILKVEGGSVLASGEQYGTAISNSGETAVTTIGSQTTFSYANPTIKGTEYGVNNENGTYSYYAGRIYGKTNTTNVTESAIKDTYEVREFMEDGYKGQILLPEGDTTYVSALSTETTFNVYTSVSSGVGTGTIILLQNVTGQITTAVGNNTVLELNGKTITYNANTVFNRATLRVVDSSEEKTGEIISTVSAAIYNNVTSDNGKANCIVESGKIVGNKYGIHNYSTYTNGYATFSITGGEIEGTTYGIYNYGSASGNVIINIGEDDGMVSTTTPIITGGIFNQSTSGVINYYDGKLKNANGETIIQNTTYPGTVNIEQNSIKVEYTEDGYKTNILVAGAEGKTLLFTETEPVLYDTVQEAIDAVESLTDGEDPSDENISKIMLLYSKNENIVVPANKNIEICLNGNNLTSNGTTITNNGNLRISNTDVNAKVETTANTVGANAIINNGTLQIEGGTIIASGTDNGNAINNNGTLNIGSESKYDTSNPLIKGTTYGIYSENSESTYNYYSGRIYGKTNATSISEGTIKETYVVKTFMELGIEGKVILPGDGIYGALKITDGVCTAYTTAKLAMNAARTGTSIIIMLEDSTGMLENYSDATLELNGHKAESASCGIYNYGSLRVVDSSKEKTGKIIATGSGDAICNTDHQSTGSTVSFILESGTIESNSDGVSNYLNYGSNRTINCTILGGKITSKSYGIYNCTNASYQYRTINCNILGGEIESTAQYGVYSDNCAQRGDAINTYIGTDDENTSTTTPKIIGNRSAIYQSNANSYTGTATTYIYDGKLMSITGSPVQLREPDTGTLVCKENYTLSTTTEVVDETTYNVATLAPIVANVGTIPYASLQEAIDASTNVSVYLQNDTQESINIASGKTVNLYLEGHKISTLDTAIINSGNLFLDDSTELGEIIGKNIGIVNNESARLYLRSGIIKGEVEAISNLGTINIPQNCTIEETTEGNYKVNYFQKVAEIGNVKYYSLDTAIAAVPTDGTKTTIKMLNNSSTATTITIAANKNVVLDLNGKTISSTSVPIVNNGTLEIIDSSTGGIITSLASVSNIITNNSGGTLIIKGGTIKLIGTTSVSDRVIKNAGTVTLVNGTIYGQNTASSSIVGINGGNVEIAGGAIEIIGGNNSVYGLWNNAILTMTSGKIEVTGQNETLGINSSITNAIHTITGGIIKSKGGTRSYGIKVQTSTLTLGNNDGTVGTTLPYIMGDTYGISGTSESSIINFYDGFVTGGTAWWDNIGTLITEENYVINTTTNIETNYQETTLLSQ